MRTPIRRTPVVLASVLVAGVGVAVVASCSSPDPSASASSPAASTSSPATSTSSAPTTSVSPPPATTSSPPSATAPTSTAAPRARQVHVVTTFAGWNATSGAVEVGGYAIVVEPVGTCTLQLTKGDQVVTRKEPASADATTVACGGFSVPGSALTAGQWKAVLAYASPRSTGQAPAMTVKVP